MESGKCLETPDSAALHPGYDGDAMQFAMVAMPTLHKTKEISVPSVPPWQTNTFVLLEKSPVSAIQLGDFSLWSK